MYPNRYPGICVLCRDSVKISHGFVQKEAGKYVTYCGSCADKQAVSTPAPRSIPSAERKVTADGSIVTPYDPASLPLLRSIPGARWNPQRKCWTFSTDMKDRRRVLEVLAMLKLDIPPELNVVELSEAALRAQTTGLYPYQVVGVDFLSKKSHALLADDMGLGKSAQSLLAIQINGSAVVICPAAVKYNWKNEVAKWRKDLTAIVVNKDSEFFWPKENQVVIINFDILPSRFTYTKNKDTDVWESNATIQDIQQAKDCTLIIDEAHRVKNSKSLRSQRVNGMRRICNKIWALSGTPMENRPLDLWSILNTLGMSREVFSKWDKFVDLFNGRETKYGWEFGVPKPEVPERLRRIMLRRLKSEVLPELPQKTYTDLVVNGVPQSLTAQMDKLWEEFAPAISTYENLPDFEKFSQVRALLAESRIPALIEYVEDCEEQEVPIVVASAHLAPINELAKRDGWKIITGDISPEKRANIVEDFQSGKLKGIGITIRAGGLGITLTHAAKIVFVDLDWNPAANAQAEDRICRIGQTSNKIEVVRMVSEHSLDKHIQRLLISKQELIYKSIDSAYQYGDYEPKPIENVGTYINQRAENIVNRLAKADNFKMPAITPELAQQVRDTLADMLARCDGAQTIDGVGFNKPDSVVARYVLPRDLPTDIEVEAAYRMLFKYHTTQIQSICPALYTTMTSHNDQGSP